MMVLRSHRVTMSTVLICAFDPADRVVARSTFADRDWHVIESSPGDVRQVVRSIKLDVVVVVGGPDTHAMTVGLLTADERITVQQITRVRFPTDAYDAAARVAAQVSGMARKR